MKNARLFLNSFWLKIIAIVTMSIDHVGMIIFYQFNDTTSMLIHDICRTIGRVSLPLFAFMIVEGIFHSRNVAKYMMRIGISALVIALGLFGAKEIMKVPILAMPYIGNIFVDFLLGGTMIACLRLKNYHKLWAVIPFGLYCLLLNADYDVFYMICLQYEWYSLGIILLFFIGHYLTDYFVKLQTNTFKIDEEGYKMTSHYQTTKNIINALLFMTYSLAVFFIIDGYPQISAMNNSMQVNAIVASVFIIFYNGKRGYNKKWFQYGCYVYYAMHIVLLFGISLIV